MMSRGADIKANTLGAGGALELLEHAILLDAARDDDGGRDAEPLVREVDLLGWLRALELVNRNGARRARTPKKATTCIASDVMTTRSWLACVAIQATQSARPILSLGRGMPPSCASE